MPSSPRCATATSARCWPCSTRCRVPRRQRRAAGGTPSLMRGARAVAGYALTYSRQARFVQPALVNGTAALAIARTDDSSAQSAAPSETVRSRRSKGPPTPNASATSTTRDPVVIAPDKAGHAWRHRGVPGMSGSGLSRFSSPSGRRRYRPWTGDFLAVLVARSSRAACEIVQAGSLIWPSARTRSCGPTGAGVQGLDPLVAQPGPACPGQPALQVAAQRGMRTRAGDWRLGLPWPGESVAELAGGLGKLPASPSMKARYAVS
jgi:hypothetical protein